MLCRALLVAIAISYLICVLFLSGIQKEDLDVSLLRKLQRYNVDVEDLTDKKLRKECLNISDSSLIEENEGYGDRNNTSKKPATTTEGIATASYFGTLDTNELEILVKYLKNKKYKSEASTPENNVVKRLNKNKMKIIFDRMLSETNANIKQKGGPEIQHKPDESSLDVIVDFWKTYMKSIQLNNNISSYIVTETKPAIEKTDQNENARLKQNDIKTVNNNSKEIKNIISKHSTLKDTFHVQIQNKTEERFPKTDLPQVNTLLAKSHEIEQQFASSIAAINKLNENIATLQNNLNAGKYLSTNPAPTHKDNLLTLDQVTDKKPEKVHIVTEKVANNISDTLKNSQQVTGSYTKNSYLTSDNDERKEPNNQNINNENVVPGVKIEQTHYTSYAQYTKDIIKQGVTDNQNLKEDKNTHDNINIKELQSSPYSQNSQDSVNSDFTKQPKPYNQMNQDQNNACTSKNGHHLFALNEKNSLGMTNPEYTTNIELSDPATDGHKVTNSIQQKQYPYTLHTLSSYETVDNQNPKTATVYENFQNVRDVTNSGYDEQKHDMIEIPKSIYVPYVLQKYKFREKTQKDINKPVLSQKQNPQEITNSGYDKQIHDIVDIPKTSFLPYVPQLHNFKDRNKKDSQDSVLSQKQNSQKLNNYDYDKDRHYVVEISKSSLPYVPQKQTIREVTKNSRNHILLQNENSQELTNYHYDKQRHDIEDIPKSSNSPYVPQKYNYQKETIIANSKDLLLPQEQNFMAATRYSDDSQLPYYPQKHDFQQASYGREPLVLPREQNLPTLTNNGYDKENHDMVDDSKNSFLPYVPQKQYFQGNINFEREIDSSLTNSQSNPYTTKDSGDPVLTDQYNSKEATNYGNDNTRYDIFNILKSSYLPYVPQKHIFEHKSNHEREPDIKSNYNAIKYNDPFVPKTEQFPDITDYNKQENVFYSSKSIYLPYGPQKPNFEIETKYHKNKPDNLKIYTNSYDTKGSRNPFKHQTHILPEVIESTDRMTKGDTEFLLQTQNMTKARHYEYEKHREPENHVHSSFAENYQKHKDLLDRNKPNENRDMNNDNTKSLPLDMIKQIAESVKDIVLKDLRLNITTSPALTTTATPATTALSTTRVSPVSTIATTTDIASTTQRLDLSKVQIATQAIEKFLEVFEELKNVQEKSVLIKDKLKNKSDLVAKPNSKALVPSHHQPKINPYGRGSSNFVPIVGNPYASRLPNAHYPYNLIPNGINYNMMTPLERVALETEKQGPITIQTNVNEIQPLPIAMKNPDSLNSNIIITTQSPFWSKNKGDRWNFMSYYGQNPDQTIKKEKITNINTYSQMSHKNNNNIIKNTDKTLNNGENVDNERTRFNLLEEMKERNHRNNEHDIKAVEFVDTDQKSEEIAYRNNKQYNEYSNTDEKSRYLNSKNVHKYTLENPDYKFYKHNNTNNYGNYQSGKRENYDFSNNKEESTPRHKKIYQERAHGHTIPGLTYHEQQFDPINNHNQPVDVNPYLHKGNKHKSSDADTFIHEDTVNSKINERNEKFENMNYKDYIRFKKREKMYEVQRLNNVDEISKMDQKYFTEPNLESNTNSHGMTSRINNNYDNYPNSHFSQKNHIDHLNVTPSEDLDNPYLHANSENRNKYMGTHNYDDSVSKFNHNENEYDNHNMIDQMKSKINQIEKYLDHPNQIELLHPGPKTRENQLETFEERAYAKPKNSIAKNSYGFSNQINTNVKFKNVGKYISEEDLNHEFKSRGQELVDPYSDVYKKQTRFPVAQKELDSFNHRYDASSLFKSKDQTNNSHNPYHMEIITAMIGGNRDRYRSSGDIEIEKERNSPDSQQYRPQSDSSDVEKRPHPDSAEAGQYNVQPTKNHKTDVKHYPNFDVRGYHEKSEASSDSWPESPSDCGPDEHCKLKIFSRQQIPLDGIKSGKYDDTHFKNFLKTQQKVNQMLERILATKDVVQSAEAL